MDPRGLAPFEFDLSTAGGAAVSLTKDRAMLETTMDSLRILADETDGRAIVNSNDLDTGLRQIIRDSSAYYLLGYTSTLNQPDGKFHKINVRLKRPGLQVRARPGYLAMTATEAERALTPKKPGPPPAVTEALERWQRRRSSAASSIRGPGSGCRQARTERPGSPMSGARRPARRSAPRGAGAYLADCRWCQFRSLLPGQRRLRRAVWSSKCRPGPNRARDRGSGCAGEVIDRETREDRGAEPGPRAHAQYAASIPRADASRVAEADD